MKTVLAFKPTLTSASVQAQAQCGQRLAALVVKNDTAQVRRCPGERPCQVGSMSTRNARERAPSDCCSDSAAVGCGSIIVERIRSATHPLTLPLPSIFPPISSPTSARTEPSTSQKQQTIEEESYQTKK